MSGHASARTAPLTMLLMRTNEHDEGRSDARKRRKWGLGMPEHDQWVLGPGTADAHVVPPARRRLVSHQANMVLLGGVVSGTWSLSDDQVVVAWFAEAGSPAREALAEEVARLANILDRPLYSSIQVI